MDIFFLSSKTPLSHPSKVQSALGLTGVANAPHSGLFAGAATIQLSTHMFYEGLGVRLMEMYGATESQLQTVNLPGRRHRPGSVGAAVFGTRSAILDPDAGGCGEIAGNSRNVVMGYHK